MRLFIFPFEFLQGPVNVLADFLGLLLGLLLLHNQFVPVLVFLGAAGSLEQLQSLLSSSSTSTVLDERSVPVATAELPGRDLTGVPGA